MQNPAKQTGAEMSREGYSASLSPVASTRSPSTPTPVVFPSTSTEVIATSSAVYQPQSGTSGILRPGLIVSQSGTSQPQPGTSGILRPGLIVSQPGTSQPQPGTSKDILQTDLFLSGLDQNSMTESRRSLIDGHRLSILQDDLYLSDSDSDGEAVDYELDLNSPTSDHAINISYTTDHVSNTNNTADHVNNTIYTTDHVNNTIYTTDHVNNTIYPIPDHKESRSDSVDETTNVGDQTSDNEDASTDSGDSCSVDDEDIDVSDSDSDLSDDDGDLSDDDGELSDDEAESSDEDEVESSSDSSEDEVDTVNCVSRVRRRPLHRADVLLYKTSPSTSRCLSTTMVQEPGRGVKRKRDADESGFTPKRIKLEEKRCVKRKGASSEHAFDDKRRKLEPIPSASSGMNHTRKRRGTSHSDPYVYPPSILKRQKMSDKGERVKANPCPKTCPCIAGNRVSRVRLRRLRRKYPVIQPLHKKLLNNRVLGPGNMSQHQCCVKGCRFRWLSKAVSHYALLDDYRPSDLGVQDFNWGQWKQGKGHVMARLF